MENEALNALLHARDIEIRNRKILGPLYDTVMAGEELNIHDAVPLKLGVMAYVLSAKPFVNPTPQDTILPNLENLAEAARMGLRSVQLAYRAAKTMTPR